ncbi:uncharacterized protein [Ptychodera flava]|uniref:uncharacterized protein n=1 Tax=Ptychodera flava TaxID=63121 RepID=UPI00396A66B7
MLVVYALLICGLLYSFSGNAFEHDQCVIIDSNSSLCLDLFFDYWGGSSFNGSADPISHQWVKFLDVVYDYDDEDLSTCYIREAKDTFDDGYWTRHGYSTCTVDEVKTFNQWWENTCQDECGLDNNCRRYGFYFDQHLWNNCSWDYSTGRPGYTITLP